MSLSYSALISSGRSTLPSVDSWAQDNNILRDPPKSLYTRRIDKVGETSSITTMIDDSGDRACEAINLYGRGINPSVSVDYSNTGRNGGQNSVAYSSRSQAYLPYTIAKDGAFRPPSVTEFELLPLSRLPRIWTSSFAQPGFADFSKKMRVCGTAETTKEVKNSILKTSVKPTATYIIEVPISQTYDIKNNIQNPLKTAASAGVRTIDNTTQHVQTPTKEVYTDTMHAFANSNLYDNTKYVNKSQLDTSRYIIDDTSVIEYTAPHSGTEQRNNTLSTDVYLERKLPEHYMRSNKSQTLQKKLLHDRMEKEFKRKMPLTNVVRGVNVAKRENFSSRDYKIANKPNIGGYEGSVQKPQVNKENFNYMINNTEKGNISRSINETYNQRRYDM